MYFVVLNTCFAIIMNYALCIELDGACRTADGDAVAWNVVHDDGADADDGVAADGRPLDDPRAGPELGALPDVDVAGDVHARMDGGEVVDDGVMADLAVEIDDDMVADMDVDGQDAVRADDASFADGHGVGFLDGGIEQRRVFPRRRYGFDSFDDFSADFGCADGADGMRVRIGGERFAAAENGMAVNNRMMKSWVVIDESKQVPCR